MADQLKSETLDFIYEHTKNAAENQLHDADASDTKMVNILMVASLIIGLVSFSIRQANGNDTSESATNYFAVGLLAVTLLSYVVICICAFKHLWIKTYRRNLQADFLWNECWQDDVFSIKHTLVQDTSDAYKHNRSILQKKKRTIKIALLAIGTEVFLVGTYLILSLLA